MPVYSFSLKFNTVDVATYGLFVAEIPNNWDAAAVTYPEIQVPGRRGIQRTSAKRVYAPMDFAFNGNQVGSSLSDFESKRDALGAICIGDVQVIAGNQPSRYRTGIINIQYPTLYPSAASAAFKGTIHCEDPLLYATSATTVTGAAATDVACALGTEDSYAVVTVTSPGGSFTLTNKDHTGATIATAGFTGSGTSWVIDMLNQQVTVDGTRHDEYLTSGNFFALRAVDGVFGSSSPSIRTSAGSISITYTQTFR